MELKLREPGASRPHNIFIDLPCGEIHCETLKAFDRDAINHQLDVHRGMGRATRLYMGWSSGQTEQVELAEIIIPGRTKTVVVLTNYDAYLMRGSVMISRLFRHVGSRATAERIWESAAAGPLHEVLA